MAKQIKTIKDLQPQRQNVNKHTQRGLGLLEDSIQRDGWIGAITVAADGETFDGSARIEVGAATGFEDAIVVRSDGSKPIVHIREDIPTADDAKAKRLGVAANRIPYLDFAEDVDVLRELAADGIDLSDLYTADEFQGLLDDEEGAGADELLTDADEVPENVETRCKSGDLWQLGRHRLLCGDSTKREDVERLMGGEKAQMVWSDPPYGYEYQSNMRTKSQKFEVLANDDKILDGFIPHLEHCSKGWVLVCTSWKVIREWMDVCASLGDMQNLIVWDKGGGGMGDLKHSLLTDYELILAYNRGAEITGKRIGSVWSIAKDAAGDYDHATQKPVALPVMALDAFAPKNALVFDPFLGSGTGIISAEKTGRKCYGIEISPKYCDVIIQRYENATGNKAELIEHGKE